MNLKKFTKKALGIFAFAFTMSLLTVAAFGYKYTAPTTDSNGVTTTVWDFSSHIKYSTGTIEGKYFGEKGDCTDNSGIYIFNSKVGTTGNEINIREGGIIYIPIQPGTVQVTVTTYQTNKNDTKYGLLCDVNGKILGKNIETTSATIEDVTPYIKTIDGDTSGQKYIAFVSYGDFKPKKITLEESAPQKYQVSGTLTNKSSFPDAKLFLGDTEVTMDGSSFTCEKANGIYAIKSNNQNVFISATNSEGTPITSVTVEDAAASGINVTFTDKPKYTVSGNVSTLILNAGDTITFESPEYTGTATVTGAYDYSVDLPNGNYTVTVSNTEKQYLLQSSCKSIIVNGAAATLDIKGDLITTWDFTKASLPAKKIEKSSSTYKGLIVTTQNRFEVTSNRVQVDKTTLVKIPVTGKGTLEISFSAGHGSPTIEGNTTAAAGKSTVSYNYDAATTKEPGYVTVEASSGGGYWYSITLTPSVSFPTESSENIVVSDKPAKDTNGYTMPVLTIADIAETTENGCQFKVTLNKDCNADYEPEKMFILISDGTTTTAYELKNYTVDDKNNVYVFYAKNANGYHTPYTAQAYFISKGKYYYSNVIPK